MGREPFQEKYQTGKHCNDPYLQQEPDKGLACHIKIPLYQSHPVLTQEKVPPMRSNRKERFLDALPVECTYKDLLAIGASFGISERSTQRYIADFTKANLLLRDSRSVYLRVFSL